MKDRAGGERKGQWGERQVKILHSLRGTVTQLQNVRAKQDLRDQGVRNVSLALTHSLKVGCTNHLMTYAYT